MKYSLLDLNYITNSNEPMISACYELWRDVYKPILEECGETIRPDLFYRAKLLSVIHEGARPIAFCLHNNFAANLSGMTEHGYFEPTDLNTRSFLKVNKHQVFSVEWVTVHPAERGKFTKLQKADLIMGLAFKAAIASPYSCVMGFSRTDLKADKLAGKFGVQCLGMTTRHGIECGVMFLEIEKLTDHPTTNVAHAIQELWDNGNIESPYLKLTASERKAA